MQVFLCVCSHMYLGDLETNTICEIGTRIWTKIPQCIKKKKKQLPPGVYIKSFAGSHKSASPCLSALEITLIDMESNSH